MCSLPLCDCDASGNKIITPEMRAQRKRKWMTRPLQLQVTKNKSRFEVRLFRNGGFWGWDDGKTLAEAVKAVRALWLRSMPPERRRAATPKVSAVCWRCGLGPLYCLEQPLPSCADNGAASHYACISQTFDPQVRVKGDDGKMTLVPRPGARGRAERWLSISG